MNYFIAFSGRTGSNLLCDLLTKTERLGNPQEHFNFGPPHYDRLWGNGLAIRWGVTDYSTYYRLYLERLATSNGVTAAKLTYEHYTYLVAGLGYRPKVDKWVWLRRANKLRQAISFYKARATMKARLLPGESLKADPPLDSLAILQRGLHYIAEERWWDSEFKRLGVVPLMLWYKELVSDTVEVVQSVSQYLGIPITSVPTSDHQRMANETSETWYDELLPKWRAIQG